jgi:di/tricarboxylate transporter
MMPHVSREAECSPHLNGRVSTALAATVLVVMAVLIATGALLLIVTLIPPVIHAAQTLGSPLKAKQLTWGDGKSIAAVLIFAGTYLVIAIGKLPYYRLDRAGAALLGASLMAGLGVVSLDDAYRAIDFDTITLLLGMMIVVANLRLSGFFRLVNNWVVTRAHHPLLLLMAIVLVAGSFSAFLVNDTVCLALTPLVLDLAIRLKRDPVPYLLAIPMASNVGSTAPITRNPQNMIIGGLSRIPYGTFAGALWPVAAVGLILTVLLIALLYRREFLPARASRPLSRAHRIIIGLSLQNRSLSPSRWWSCFLPACASQQSRSWAAHCCCSPAGSSPKKSILKSTGRSSSCSLASSLSSLVSKQRC